MRVALLALLLAACAPTALAPSIIRYEPVDPAKGEVRFGVRTGPRLGNAITTRASGAFNGEADSFVPPNLGIAYDFAYTLPITRGFAVHFGAQGEVLYTIPLPAFGAMVGVSYRFQLGRVSIAPALGARGATDFMIGTLATRSSIVSGDASLTISGSDGELTRFGLAPFASVQHTFMPTARSEATTIFVGGLFFAHWKEVELFAGAGRVITTAGDHWNVPLIGVRGGGN